MPSDLTVGGEYLGSELEDISGYRTEAILQNTHNLSGFLQNEWKTDRVMLRQKT